MAFFGNATQSSHETSTGWVVLGVCRGDGGGQPIALIQFNSWFSWEPRLLVHARLWLSLLCQWRHPPARKQSTLYYLFLDMTTDHYQYKKHSWILPWLLFINRAIYTRKINHDLFCSYKWPLYNRTASPTFRRYNFVAFLFCSTRCSRLANTEYNFLNSTFYAATNVVGFEFECNSRSYTSTEILFFRLRLFEGWITLSTG